MTRSKNNSKWVSVIVVPGLLIFMGLGIFAFERFSREPVLPKNNLALVAEEKQEFEPKKEIPKTVKAVYATMYTAGDKQMLGHLLELINNYELNAIVIDVKDSDGRLIFDSVDVGGLIKILDENNIYVIGRVVVFQDNRAAKENTGFVIKNQNGEVWRDRAGFAWIDPASREGWDYILNISKRALDAGFDEINYDYIRFPSEGLLDSTVYPAWNASTSKSDTIKNFADFSVAELKKHDSNSVVSIDIFGYTFLRNHDLGIGQKLEYMIESFDYIYPMVYPSHYAPGNFGYQNPALHPYEVIKKTLDSGLDRLGEKAGERQVLYAKKIRPWLQAFDLGAEYTPERMKAQIQAANDALGGISGNEAGWLLWDPKNRYNRAEEYLK